MKKKSFNLSKQLLCLLLGLFLVLSITFGYLFPKVLLPVYENNLYTILSQSLDLVTFDARIANLEFKSDIAYIYVREDGTVMSSSNLSELYQMSSRIILLKVNSGKGKFNYLGKRYYYISNESNGIKRIAVTDDKYVHKIKNEIVNIIFPIIFFTMLIALGVGLLWTFLLIMKIERLKEKVDNLDNDNYNKKFNYYFDDELVSLSNSIDDMKDTLKVSEEYKNQMYQNISHDFKTPLTVIKSYIEGIEDGVQDPSEGNKIIKEQVEKLEQKVRSLLYLNKINYLKDFDVSKNEKTNVARVIKVSVKKMKLQRRDVEWKLNLAHNAKFYGSFDMWEAIIDNLLSNFIRYAEKTISIVVKNNKIILYNDGPNIDQNILNDLFTPYKKGIKGEFGLGLSIVKKTISLIGYEVSVRNTKKGVSFIIK